MKNDIFQNTLDTSSIKYIPNLLIVTTSQKREADAFRSSSATLVYFQEAAAVYHWDKPVQPDMIESSTNRGWGEHGED